MPWTRERIEDWIENYYALKDYSVSAWAVLFIDREKKLAVRGKRNMAVSPFEMQACMNIEFDLAIKAVKKFYGYDVMPAMGNTFSEALNVPGIGRLIGLLINSNRKDSTWMSKVI